MKKLSVKQKLAYGTGNLGYATISQTLNYFIMFFGTSVLGIGGTLVGLAISIGVLWDAISDPLIGHMSDGSHSPLGRRHGYILYGTLGMCAVNLLIWIIPISSSELIKFVWLLVALLLLETFCTMFATPYLALGLDLIPDGKQQTSLQCYKTIFFLIGMMMPSILMFFFMPNTNQSQLLTDGYVKIAYVSSLLCLITGLITFFGTKKDCARCNYVPVQKQSLLAIVKDIFLAFKNKNFRVIILGYSISLIASAVLSGAGMHMFTYCFHFSSKQLSCVMVVLILSAIISQFFWEKLAAKNGKKRALIVGLIVAISGIMLIGCLFMFRYFFSTNVLVIVCSALISICGFGTGVLYSLPISIFFDILSSPEVNVGTQTATFSGVMTLAYKCANAFALFVIGIMLDVIKFSSSSPVQSLAVQNKLGAVVIFGVALPIVVSMCLYGKYKEGK